MGNIVKKFCKKFLVVVSLLCVTGIACGFELRDTVPVNQTSDTAANAKTVATNLARRQILYNILSQYAQREELNNLIYNASDDDLMNLITSSSVANEQISSDTYSANITMVIDNYAARKWLDDAGIQNWIPLEESSEKFTVLMVVPNGLADWADLKRITRYGGVEIETQTMAGNQIIAKLPLNYRSKFMIDIRDAGWKYTNNGGILQVWK